MIRLTRLNGIPLVLNSDLIEHIEVTPDTVITLTTGQILRVRESADEVIHRIVDFRRKIYGPEALPADLSENRDWTVTNPMRQGCCAGGAMPPCQGLSAERESGEPPDESLQTAG
jgi:flagellar protein FlbD